MKFRFSSQQLEKIREQALIYQCACPAQLCVNIQSVRELYETQLRCMDSTEADQAVHSRIRTSSEKCHLELEDCLEEVLRIEGWDMSTLEMPENLKKNLLNEI